MAAATTISAVHPDIIQTHILTRLDGPALASAASTCSQLYALCSYEHLWANACHCTWPSTNSPRVRHVISTFPKGSRSFFADSFPAPLATTQTTSPTNPDRTPQLISAVDLFHRQHLVCSKVVETETVTGWFRCSPFRVDLLDPKDVVKYPAGGDDTDTCRDLGEELRLSWIVIDPASRRAVNVSSGKAVTVQRHWLSGEVKVRFATVVKGERGTASEVALCSVVVLLIPHVTHEYCLYLFFGLFVYAVHAVIHCSQTQMASGILSHSQRRLTKAQNAMKSTADGHTSLSAWATPSIMQDNCCQLFSIFINLRSAFNASVITIENKIISAFVISVGDASWVSSCDLIPHAFVLEDKDNPMGVGMMGRSPLLSPIGRGPRGMLLGPNTWVIMDKLLLLFRQDLGTYHVACEHFISELFCYAILHAVICYFLTQRMILPLVFSSITSLFLHTLNCWVLVFNLGLRHAGVSLAIGIFYWLATVWFGIETSTSFTRINCESNVFNWSSLLLASSMNCVVCEVPLNAGNFSKYVAANWVLSMGDCISHVGTNSISTSMLEGLPPEDAPWVPRGQLPSNLVLEDKDISNGDRNDVYQPMQQRPKRMVNRPTHLSVYCDIGYGCKREYWVDLLEPSSVIVMLLISYKMLSAFPEIRNIRGLLERLGYM